MKKNLPIILSILIIIIVLITYFRMAPTENTEFKIEYKDRDVIRLGRVLYADNCASCHGSKLEGETANWRQRNSNGTLPAPPHDETGHTWHHGDALLFDIIKFGGKSDEANGFISNMPAFKDDLSDLEIHNILAFIKSSWPVSIQQRHDNMQKSN